MFRPLLVVFLASTLASAEPPISPQDREAILAAMQERKAAASAVLEKAPNDIQALTSRGDASLFLGDAKAAVADFEKEIALEPSRDPGHWRLGIAYYYAGEYAKSAAQFAKYHAYDNRDRENGVWKFFAQARVDGIEKARKEMLEYTRFDREPFPAVYDMLAGKKTGADVLAEMENKGLKNDALVMFFAHYYVGWNEELLGKKDAAKEHLAEALRMAQKAGAGGGPGYMGQVARLHYEALSK